MSAASSVTQSQNVASSYAPVGVPGILRQKFTDYLELCRPRIALMTMVSVVVGFTLASPVVFAGSSLLAAVIGIVQLVAASSILNQYLERLTDARMTRTSARPIATGRISGAEAACVALSLTVIGSVVLWNFVNPLTALATLGTLVVYIGGYTLLKTRSSVCTTVGAIPGAMPPVLGWLAAGGAPGVEAVALFAIFFVWQFPHFLAIGWIHRGDYRRAGLRMLPSFSDGGFLTGLLAVSYAAVFVPISALPAYIGMSGDLYLAAAIVLSVVYLTSSIKFAISRSDKRARQLLFVSLICLPALLIALVADFLRLTAIT